MLRNKNGRLTPAANYAAGDAVRTITPIYNKFREQGWTHEDVYYLLSTAAHELVMDEALRGDLRPVLDTNSTPADKYLAETKAENIDPIELFFKLRDNVVYPYFDGFEDGYVVYALEDYRDYYWELPFGEGREGEVHYAETIEDLKDKEAGNYYVNDIYTQRFYNKWVWRGKDYTMIFCDTHTDGNKFFGVYSNNKEIREEHKNEEQE
jgi:hypothetical protein